VSKIGEESKRLTIVRIMGWFAHGQRKHWIGQPVFGQACFFALVCLYFV
jgi:hypothetical protein